MLLLSSADFFQNYIFRKISSGTLSECQIVWILIRTDILSVLIWVQTVCKRQKLSLAGKELIEVLTLKIYVYPDIIKQKKWSVGYENST